MENGKWPKRACPQTPLPRFGPRQGPRPGVGGRVHQASSVLPLSQLPPGDPPARLPGLEGRPKPTRQRQATLSLDLESAPSTHSTLAHS